MGKIANIHPGEILIEEFLIPLKKKDKIRQKYLEEYER